MFTFTIIMISIVLPLYMIYWQCNGKTVNKSQLLFKTAASGLVIYTLIIFNNWAFTSVFLRYLYVLLYLFFAGYSWWQAWEQPWRSPLAIRQWAPVIGAILLLVLCSFILADIAGVDDVPPNPVEIEFPFKRGTFFMAQAGNSPAMNGHMSVMDETDFRGQTWALDILQLNFLGFRANGIYPQSPKDYYIFGTPVYAPCNGGVVSAEDSLPDLNPPERDRDNLAGNYVKLECEEGFIVLMAHLQQGSVTVAEGDVITVGSRIGTVGNSGNTSEPHLHIHAQAAVGETTLLNSDPLPILFKGHGWLKRNDIVHMSR
jgi:hypothetical protein